MYNENDHNKISKCIECYYESIYYCLCANFSLAYLSGSEYYVGESLYDWWIKVEANSKDYSIKYKKLEYIISILDDFVNN